MRYWDTTFLCRDSSLKFQCCKVCHDIKSQYRDICNLTGMSWHGIPYHDEGADKEATFEGKDDGRCVRSLESGGSLGGDISATIFHAKRAYHLKPNPTCTSYGWELLPKIWLRETESTDGKKAFVSFWWFKWSLKLNLIFFYFRIVLIFGLFLIFKLSGVEVIIDY